MGEKPGTTYHVPMLAAVPRRSGPGTGCLPFLGLCLPAQQIKIITIITITIIESLLCWGGRNGQEQADMGVPPELEVRLFLHGVEGSVRFKLSD